MKKLAIITILYDYPEFYQPTFQNALLRDFDKDDLYILRYNSVDERISSQSYYFKFTYYRIHKIYSFIEENILNKYEYFILLDATDVGYVGNINSISDIMESYDTKILFGAERNLWPDTSESHLYSTKNIDSPYKFLNAGVFCAEPKSYLNHLLYIKSRGLVGLCDQGNWQIEYLKNDDIKLDYKNLLVLNTFEAKEDISLEDNQIIFKTNRPLFVHDNGGHNDKTLKLLDFFK
jgi:hypothetical protein